MRYTFSICFLFITLISCSAQKSSTVVDPKKSIDTSLEAWHKAAAGADFDAYFGLMTEDAVFLGTDATENWQIQEFKAFSKPYFDKGKAWSFSTLERNIYLDIDGETAWFDEHLDTQMGICRGSGVMKKTGNTWKVQHYVLSIAVPNENVSALTVMKADWDRKQMEKMRNDN
ncbi:hypothetical protein EAX61_08710 [Dokdonia sinensis]|uniref:SnoaL-like domain-containing protein n=1 Tax=Dokdonia sinensis TaxID=2479847 RepID=A0A3M0G9H9_9FLAO|nr:nuclear transport factor 2 family protein [Dokdonia sinensis]RMB59132.1 hypothetical protein EAX61_08710 [Dokdonia sinensis]